MSYTDMSYTDMSYTDMPCTHMSYTDTSYTEPHDLQVLASKACGAPRGEPRRVISRLSVGKIRAAVVGFTCVRILFEDVEMSL